MAIETEIRFKDRAGAYLGTVTMSQDSPVHKLEYNRFVNGVGHLSMLMSRDADVDSWLVVDNQIEVWRGDLAEDLDLYLEWEGFYRTPDRDWKEDIETTRIECNGYNDLLSRAIVYYQKASAQSAKSGIAETVMKEYVDENIGPGATSPPRITANVMSGVSIEADAAQGATWEGERAWEPVLNVCQEVAQVGSVDYDIVGVGAAQFEFRVYYPQRGLDRTYIGVNPATGLNGAGNVPVTFSVERGNMIQPRFVEDRTGDINVAVVLGPLGPPRTTTERTLPAELLLSPWNRREATVEAQEEANAAGRNAAGDRELARKQRVISLEFTTMQLPDSYYGKHYHFGDRVTAYYAGQTWQLQIAGVKIRVDSGGEKVEPIFTDIARQWLERLSARERMASRIGDLDRRVTHLEALG